MVKEDYKKGFVPPPKVSTRVVLSNFSDQRGKREAEPLFDHTEDRRTEEMFEFDYQISALANNYRSGVNNDYFLGTAYVSFATYEQRIAALSLYGRSGWLYDILGMGPVHTKLDLNLEVNGKNHQLWVERASAPQDIIWENLSYSKMSRLIRSLIGLLVSASLMVLDFILIMWLTYLGQKWRSAQTGETLNTFESFVISYIVSFIVFVIDFCLQYT